MLDAYPRVVVVRGGGTFAIGGDAKAARIAGDLCEQATRAIIAAESYGRYTPIGEACSTWSPGSIPPQPLRRTRHAPVGKDVDNGTALQVDDDCAVAPRSPPAPVIYTNDPDRRAAVSESDYGAEAQPAPATDLPA